MDPHGLDLVALAASTGAAVLGALAFRRARAAAAIADAPLGRDAEPSPSFARRVAAPLAARLRPAAQADLEQLQTRLLRAGRRDRDAIDRFLEERVLALFAALVAGTLLASLAHGASAFLLCSLALLAGLLGPDRLLDARAARRQAAISAALPGAVDLLVTCLDAGLSLEQAIARVAADLAHASPVLAEELHITASEFDAGVALPDALRRLARRCGLDDLSAMCGVVAQAHALGAPIAHTLREYAVAQRRQRMSVLEERAGKLSTQLTIPLALFLLPAAMLIILGPAALQLVRALR
jgi:tight adherence protein C